MALVSLKRSFKNKHKNKIRIGEKYWGMLFFRRNNNKKKIYSLL